MKRDIGRSTENHFYLLHIRRERLIVRQRDREALVEAGSCVLVDSKEPYHPRSNGAPGCARKVQLIGTVIWFSALARA